MNTKASVSSWIEVTWRPSVMAEATPLLSPLPVRLYVTAADTETEVKMYPPKIDEKSIPALYRLAKELGVP